MSEPEPISPELALVAPELAAAARAALPDRPWERFAPPRPRAPFRVAAIARPSPTPVVPPRPKRRRRVVTGGRVAMAAAVTLLAASFLPPRDAPRLVPGSTLPARAAPAPLPTPAPLVPSSDPAGCVAASAPRDPFTPICPAARASRPRSTVAGADTQHAPAAVSRSG